MSAMGRVLPRLNRVGEKPLLAPKLDLESDRRARDFLKRVAASLKPNAHPVERLAGWEENRLGDDECLPLIVGLKLLSRKLEVAVCAFDPDAGSDANQITRAAVFHPHVGV